MKLIYTLIPTLMLAGCATHSTTTPEERFKKADKDGNGMVSRQEATTRIIGNAFAMYDANSDGFVTEQEYLASGGNQENFRKVNKSGSGKVSLAEAQASPLVFNTFSVSFNEADTNKDGQVTMTEYKSYLERRNAAVR